MAKKRNKAAKQKKKANVLGTSADMPRADFTKHLEEGFEDTFYDQKGTIEDVARMVAADGAEETPALATASASDVEWENTPPYGVITLVSAVLLAVYLISAVLHPEEAAAFVSSVTSLV